MAYETQCGGCTYFDFQGDCSKGYCSWYRTYYYPGDSCSHQNPREISSGCYITTIICDVLGYADDCSVLDTLRSFRDNVMQKDSKYSDLLLEYDTLGPDIAYFIKKEYEENNDREIWTQFYNFYLQPTANYVSDGKFDAAVNRYKEMVTALKEYFNLDEYNPDVINYDYTNGGHGRVKIIEQN